MPPVPAPDATSGPPPIGAAIRDRRRRLGMTLQALADTCGLSVPFLSQVERDLAMPSLISLTSIARALGVEMSYFVGTPSPGQIVRRGDEPEYLQFGGGPVVYTRLSGRHEERKMEALLITVPPGLASPVAHREGEGFWYIQEGEIEMWVGQEHFLLRAGDSAHFDQRHPYRMHNTGKAEVKMLWVGTPALL
jgi:transcriptional regulator with XRE-family HTH domain